MSTAVVVARAKVVNRPRTVPWTSVGAAAGSLLFCLAVQVLAGAKAAGFDSFPDEPAHFVGAVMVRDWLASGRWFAPFQFAQHYYDHYPFFAVGYWPPLFSIVTGLFLLLAGVGRQQAILVPAAFTAGTGWLIFKLVQKRAGTTAGCCAGILYMGLPTVRQCLNAVMVDSMTTFLCLAAATCFIQYLDKPVFGKGMLCAVCSACAILSKYSSAFIIVLPLSAALTLRRFDLLKKRGFLMQPLVVALLVGPWVFWTRRLALYGLPDSSRPFSLDRILSAVSRTFHMFPLWLAIAVVFGLAALLMRPRAWREDVVVLSLLAAGQTGLLIISPVGAEPRYLLVVAAALLVNSFIGWTEALEWIAGGRHWQTTGAVLVLLLTFVFAGSQFTVLKRAAADRTYEVVASLVKDPVRRGERLVLPSDIEGPTIAQFVAQTRQRPGHYLLRPTKTLANEDWFGGHYTFLFATPEDMMQYFRQHPVNLILWSEDSQSPIEPHERILHEMLQEYPSSWRKVAEFASLKPRGRSWTVYEYSDQTLSSR